MFRRRCFWSWGRYWRHGRRRWHSRVHLVIIWSLTSVRLFFAHGYLLTGSLFLCGWRRIRGGCLLSGRLWKWWLFRQFWRRRHWRRRNFFQLIVSLPAVKLLVHGAILFSKYKNYFPVGGGGADGGTGGGGGGGGGVALGRGREFLSTRLDPENSFIAL